MPHGVLLDRHSKYRRSNRTVGLKGPVNATRPRIESLHGAARAADKQIPSNDSWSADRIHIALKPIRPLQLQPGHLIDRKAGSVARLIANILGGRTPPIPGTFGNTR